LAEIPETGQGCDDRYLQERKYGDAGFTVKTEAAGIFIHPVLQSGVAG